MVKVNRKIIEIKCEFDVFILKVASILTIYFDKKIQNWISSGVF